MRQLNEKEGNTEPESTRNGTIVEKSETENTTNSTGNPIVDSNVTFKKSNSTISSTKKTKDQQSKQFKQPKKTTNKSRVNREILTTLLSRKKFYKLLQHKLELYVQ